MLHKNIGRWLEAHKEALAIKVKLLKPNDRMINASISQLVIAYNGLVTYDWNDWRTQENNTAGRMYVIGEFIDSFSLGVIDKVAIDAYLLLNYKLGTYYLYVLSDFSRARAFLLNAQADLKDLLSIWAKSQSILCYREEIILLNTKIQIEEKEQDTAMHDVNADLDDYRVKVGNATADALNACETVIRMLLNQLLKLPTTQQLHYVALTSFIYSVKGLIYEALGQRDTAISNLFYSLELDGDLNDGDHTPKVMNQLAVLYETTNQDHLAQKAYKELASHYRQQAENEKLSNSSISKHEHKFHYNYGSFLEKKGMLNDALGEFNLAYDYYASNDIISESRNKLWLCIETLREKIEKTATISAGVTLPSVAQVPGTLFATSVIPPAVVAPTATTSANMQP